MKKYLVVKKTILNQFHVPHIRTHYNWNRQKIATRISRADSERNM